jgi:hypothetical protein
VHPVLNRVLLLDGEVFVFDDVEISYRAMQDAIELVVSHQGRKKEPVCAATVLALLDIRLIAVKYARLVNHYRGPVLLVLVLRIRMKRVVGELALFSQGVYVRDGATC